MITPHMTHSQAFWFFIHKFTRCNTECISVMGVAQVSPYHAHYAYTLCVTQGITIFWSFFTKTYRNDQHRLCERNSKKFTRKICQLKHTRHLPPPLVRLRVKAALQNLAILRLFIVAYHLMPIYHLTSSSSQRHSADARSAALAASATTNNIQTVHTGVQVQSRSCTCLPLTFLYQCCDS